MTRKKLRAHLLTDDTIKLLDALKTEKNVTKSTFVDRAVRELIKKEYPELYRDVLILRTGI